MTYRERREAKIERLNDWAGKRFDKADELRSRTPDSVRTDWAFITQPGTIPERDRMRKRDERAIRHDQKGSDFVGRAGGIQRQLDTSIYSDDPDAIEALEAKIATLEEQRTRQKYINSVVRKNRSKTDHTLADGWETQVDPPLTKGEVADIVGYGRMMRGNYHSYNGFVTHVSANIRRNQKRLEEIRKGPVVRFIYARRDGECPDCDQPITKNAVIANPDGVWMHGECARDNHGVAWGN